MTTQTFIFCESDIYKTKTSWTPIFTFNSQNTKKVLRYIEQKQSDYFEGSANRKKEQFDDFSERVKAFNGDIHKAINTDSNIFAVSIELPTIINIQQ